jgi:hypothetical protein
VTTDIFIKTYPGDKGYHPHCIASIEKFCTGFRKTVVVDSDEPRGYLYQQVVKLTADRHTDADFILITDSDTLFKQPVTPETYLRDGKPLWLMTPWTPEMLAHPGTRAWFGVMTEFFGVEPPAEWMRRQPFMIPRWALTGLQEFCFKEHGLSIEEYVMSRNAFSEFNVIGYYLWLFHRDKIHWIDTSVDPLPELTVVQLWSHGDLESNLQQIRGILA